MVEFTHKEQLRVRIPEGVLGNCFNHQSQRLNHLHMSSACSAAPRRDSSWRVLSGVDRRPAAAAV